MCCRGCERGGVSLVSVSCNVGERVGGVCEWWVGAGRVAVGSHCAYLSPARVGGLSLQHT